MIFYIIGEGDYGPHCPFVLYFVTFDYEESIQGA